MILYYSHAAMNFFSRSFPTHICLPLSPLTPHPLSPSLLQVVMSAGGRYVIAMFATRDIAFSEEMTFDYNSVTESEEEHQESVCLCGTRFCRGSFLAMAASDSYTQVSEFLSLFVVAFFCVL